MRVRRVVAMHPIVALRLQLNDGAKPLRVEKLRPNAIVEGFDVGVLRRFSGLNEEQLDIVLLGPSLHEFGCKLGAVVRSKTGSSPP